MLVTHGERFQSRRSALISTPWSPLVADVNGDGQFTISDVGSWLAQVFFLPGDWLIWTISVYMPAVAGLLEVGDADYGGVVSGLVSACAWFVLLTSLMIAYDFVRVVDLATTRRIRIIYAELRRRVRVASVLIASRLRKR